MRKYILYLLYVIKHKWYVFLECHKNGLTWLGILHDWSKLLPSEFFPYAKHFYGKKSKGIRTGRDETGYYKPTEVTLGNWQPLGYNTLKRLWQLYRRLLWRNSSNLQGKNLED